MTLSRREIEQMLREMHIKFDADETVDALEQRLRQEHHRRWLKSVSASRSADRGNSRIRVKKRKKEVLAQSPITGPPSESAQPETSGKRSPGTVPDHPRKPEPGFRARPMDKPAPGKPWKAAADGTEPFNRKKKVFESVLRRARMCCECCGTKAREGIGAEGLEPYHILPLSQGGEHSIKNVVALCPACRLAMHNDPDPKAIKHLKRQTRAKLYDSVQVVKKKTARNRQADPRRRK